MGRERLVHELRERNVETRQYFSPPLHQQILFQQFHGNGPPNLPETERIAAGVISLPCYVALTDEDVHGVMAAFEEVAAAAPRVG